VLPVVAEETPICTEPMPEFKRPDWLTWKRVETVLLLGLIAFVLHRFAPHMAAMAGVGDPIGSAPDVSFTTLDGETFALSDLEGEVVLVNFWATWCTPCKLEMPGFEKLYRKKRDEGFVLLGVSVDRTGEAGVGQFLEERDITYPVTMQTPSIRAGFGSLPGIPTSFLIDRRGVIRHRTFGIFPAAGLGIAVDRLLQETSGPSPESAENSTEAAIRADRETR